MKKKENRTKQKNVIICRNLLNFAFYVLNWTKICRNEKKKRFKNQIVNL